MAARRHFGLAAPRGRRMARPRASGLTLMELMVSLAILAAMILLANTLLIRSRRVIQMSEDQISANGDVRALAERFRRDVSRITKDGFLILCDYNGGVIGVASPGKQLLFTATGDFHSMNSDVQANAALIDYGSSGPQILWRRAMLLNGTALGQYNFQAPIWPETDYLPIDLSTLRNYYLLQRLRSNAADPWHITDLNPNLTPREMLKYWLMNDHEMVMPDGSVLQTYVYDGNTPPNVITRNFVPSWCIIGPDLQASPNNLTTIKSRWPYLMAVTSPTTPSGFPCANNSGAIPGTTNIRIQWTDGSRDSDGALRWFDSYTPRTPQITLGRSFDWEPDINRKNSDTWLNYEARSQDLYGGLDIPEFNIERDQWNRLNPSSQGWTGQIAEQGSYVAMWTFAKKDNWPKALRMEVTVGSPGRTYEIIAYLPN